MLLKGSFYKIIFTMYFFVSSGLFLFSADLSATAGGGTGHRYATRSKSITSEGLSEDKSSDENSEDESSEYDTEDIHWLDFNKRNRGKTWNKFDKSLSDLDLGWEKLLNPTHLEEADSHIVDVLVNKFDNLVRKYLGRCRINISGEWDVRPQGCLDSLLDDYIADKYDGLLIHTLAAVVSILKNDFNHTILSYKEKEYFFLRLEWVNEGVLPPDMSSYDWEEIWSDMEGSFTLWDVDTFNDFRNHKNKDELIEALKKEYEDSCGSNNKEFIFKNIFINKYKPKLRLLMLWDLACYQYTQWENDPLLFEYSRILWFQASNTLTNEQKLLVKGWNQYSKILKEMSAKGVGIPLSGDLCFGDESKEKNESSKEIDGFIDRSPFKIAFSLEKEGFPSGSDSDLSDVLPSSSDDLTGKDKFFWGKNEPKSQKRPYSPDHNRNLVRVDDDGLLPAKYQLVEQGIGGKFYEVPVVERKLPEDQQQSLNKLFDMADINKGMAASVNYASRSSTAISSCRFPKQRSLASNSLLSGNTDYQRQVMKGNAVPWVQSMDSYDFLQMLRSADKVAGFQGSNPSYASLSDGKPVSYPPALFMGRISMKQPDCYTDLNTDELNNLLLRTFGAPPPYPGTGNENNRENHFFTQSYSYY